MSTFNFALAAKLVNAVGEIDRDELRRFVNESRRTYDALIGRENESISLRRDNDRLRHENEFLLRLINAKDVGLYNNRNSVKYFKE